MRNPPWLVAVLVLLGPAGAMLALPNAAEAARPHVRPAPLRPLVIPKYVDELPELPTIDGTTTSKSSPAVLALREFQQEILPASVYRECRGQYRKGTYVWSYTVPGRPMTYPGPTIEARFNIPTYVRYENDLKAHGNQSLELASRLPIDQTIHWADPLNQAGSFEVYKGPIPSVTHLHGGADPSFSDGHPDAWWTPDFKQKGPAFVSDTYTYPNIQEPTTLWYHDHTLGSLRLMVYAGLCGAYITRNSEREPANLPGGPADRSVDRYGHPFERVLIIQDKSFDNDAQLTFPQVGVNPSIHPYWFPEDFGDVNVVNGKSWPYLRVEPRRYRIRIIDGANARFYEFHLITRDSTEVPMWQIGSDGGLLDTPAAMSAGSTSSPLIVAPGERADLIIDFAGHEGQALTLINKANGPYPDGDPVDPETNGQVMRFFVGRPQGDAPDPSLDPSVTKVLRDVPIERPPVPAQDTRALTLNEQEGPDGPIAGYLNNIMWHHPTTENIDVGATEVWEFINLTDDTHPIHLHLIQFQALSRQDFDKDAYEQVYGEPVPGMGPPLSYDERSARTGFKVGGNPDVTPFLLGSPRNPDPNETGWKDTFRMNPGVVTRVLVRLAPQRAMALAGGPVLPGMNLFPFDPSAALGVADDGHGYPGGPGYVWHCHILDHEDNEMMRRMMITTPAASPGLVDGNPAAPTAHVELAGVHPNPVLGSARIVFTLERAQQVDLSVYDVTGRAVVTLANGLYAPGEHATTWDGRDRSGHPAPSGVYLYRLTTEERTQVQKLMLVR